MYWMFFSVFLLHLSFVLCNKNENKPNILIFHVDDQGYGDLSLNGHPTIETPNIDSLAYEGVRFT